ncbi:hypothetical protein SDC9_124571 [bioreactor metagenome]|uniref:Uncharacterized protein n=1 Tax=bioreactor metagenome TaxID=1076179 RepID=A0A645CKU9_9ZZZZ
MFHGAEGTFSREAGPVGYLKRNLFVGSPLRIDFLILGELLGDFGAGRSRVTGSNAASGLVKAAGSSRVAQHELFQGAFFLSFANFCSERLRVSRRRISYGAWVFQSYRLGCGAPGQKQSCGAAYTGEARHNTG